MPQPCAAAPRQSRRSTSLPCSGALAAASCTARMTRCIAAAVPSGSQSLLGAATSCSFCSHPNPPHPPTERSILRPRLTAGSFAGGALAGGTGVCAATSSREEEELAAPQLERA
eukprot:scaffold14166_cov64-Phaeocystis_antarctica.AAC.3